MAGKLKNIIPHLQRGLNTKQIMIYKSKIKQKKKKIESDFITQKHDTVQYFQCVSGSQ